MMATCFRRTSSSTVSFDTIAIPNPAITVLDAVGDLLEVQVRFAIADALPCWMTARSMACAKWLSPSLAAPERARPRAAR